MRLVKLIRRITLCLAVALSAGAAFAQGKGQPPQGKSPQQQMSQQDRQKMRDDMRDAYRDRDRSRQDRTRPMTREERDKLRRDVEDANRNLRR